MRTSPPAPVFALRACAALLLALVALAAAAPAAAAERPALRADGLDLRAFGESKLAAEARAAAGADLAIDVFADDPAPSGEDFGIFVMVDNLGPDDAANVSFRNVLPEGVTFLSAEGATCVANGRNVDCAVGSIAADDWADVEILARAPAADGDLVNRAEVTGGTPVDPYTRNNVATTTIRVRSDADVTVFGSTSSVAVNQNATFTVDVWNRGPKGATNVVVESTLSQNSTVVGTPTTTTTGVSCARSGDRTIRCTIPSLPARSEDTVQITIVASGLTTPGIITNTAVANASSPADPDPFDNEDSEVAVVGAPPLADLSVYLEGPDAAAAGSEYTYWLYVANEGPQAAGGVTVTVELPAGTAPRSPLPAGCTLAGTTVTCALGTLAAFAEREFPLPVTSAAPASVTATARVSAPAPPYDPDPDWNSSRSTVRILPPGATDLALDATGPRNVAVDGVHRATFFVSNWGPSAANGVTFTATLPPGVRDVSGLPERGSCTTGADGRTVTCTLGTLAIDDDIAVDVVATPTGVGTLTTSARVSHGSTDHEPANDELSLTTPVHAAGAADLAVALAESADPAAVGEALRYVVQVRNLGPAAANGATATLTLPAGLAFNAGASPGCSAAGSTVTCGLPAIPPGGAAAARVVVTPSTTGPKTTSASVSLTSDPVVENNSASQTTAVSPDVADGTTAQLVSGQVVTDPQVEPFTVIAPFEAWEGDAPLVLETTACPGSPPATAVTFLVDGEPQSTTAVGGGRYRATVPLWAVWDGALEVSATCAGTSGTNAIGSVQFFPEFGRVVNARTGAPVAGATVTLHQLPGWWARVGSHQNGLGGTCESEFSKPDAAPWSQPAPSSGGAPADGGAGLAWPTVNPMSTAADGFFGWSLEEGCWYVRVERAGYAPATSAVFGAPVLWTELRVALQPIEHTLSVQADGSGTVASTPAGISCPGDCTEAFLEGTTVTLTATPSPGFGMGPWTGACAGTQGATCVVSMTQARTAGVSFAPRDPGPPPPPPPDTRAPAVTVRAAAQKLATVRRSGLAATVGCDEACALRLEVRLAPALARRLKLPVVIGTASRSLTAAGTTRASVKLKAQAKRKLAKLRSVRVTLIVTGRDSARNARTVRKTVTLRR